MAKVALATKEPFTFIVRGTNWTYETETDPEDLFLSLKELPIQERAIEAATKAVEIFKGVVPVNEKFILDEGEIEPYMGISLDVFIKNSPNDTVYPVETYVCLANGGFYADSVKAFNALIDHIYLESKTDKVPKEVENMLLEYYKNSGRRKPRGPNKKKKKDV